MEVVRVRRSDKEEVYRLEKEENEILNRFVSRGIYRVKFTREMFDRMFAGHFGKDKVFFGIREDGKIVAILSGYVKPVPSADVGYIDNMFVSKKYYGRGYAKVLRDEFYKWLKRKGLRYCQLHVLRKNPARNIYERWGFEVDDIQMTKRL